MRPTEGCAPPDTALARLAAHFGIEHEFRDARGDNIVTSAATQRRLLRAMGVEVETEREAAIALEREMAARSRSPLPPVLVVRSEDGSCCVPVRMRSSAATGIAWRVELEDGSERSGIWARSQATSVNDPEEIRLDVGELPWGYHRLHLPELETSTTLIVTPGKCWVPPSFSEASGLWGISAQLYLLRSEQNWGIGDFADLAELVRLSAEHGCAVVGVNPLHQMFLDCPEQASPYSPLTRLYLNVLSIAVPQVAGYSRSKALADLLRSDEFKARLSACRAAEHVDYSGVASLKLEALRILHGEFANSASQDRQKFESFRNESGVSLRRTSIFQALRQHLMSRDPGMADWRKWPDGYRNAGSADVERFAQDHAAEIDFLSWLQWVADEQLAAAACAAHDAGMAIGLYRDLAVGCDSSGAETWVNPEAFLSGVQVGAPPDIFNPVGQDWGLPPFHPGALRAEAYRSFVQLIRANMRHAGGLRIDHVMGLQHLYCIPAGCGPEEGAYVSYPLDDLVGILALESHRHQCLVVGEDLGTVPEGFRDKMSAAGILSYRVLFFEQDWDSGRFLPPKDYPRLALAVAGSHDLPTLAGWWEGRDIDLKERTGLYPGDEATRQRARRDADRASILSAFLDEGVLREGAELSSERFAIAAHEFLARTGSALVVPQLDDLLGEIDQVNLPATTLEHPNWRRKYGTTLEELASSERWRLAGRLPLLRKRSGHA